MGKNNRELNNMIVNKIKTAEQKNKENRECQEYLDVLLDNKHIKEQLDLWNNEYKLKWKNAVDNSEWGIVYNVDVCDGWSRLSLNCFIDDLYDTIDMMIKLEKL